MISSATLARVFVGATVLWALALPLAPAAAMQTSSTDVWYAVAFLAYGIGSLVCHQLPERSFHLWSIPLPVCARCTGIYAGAAVAAFVMSLRGLPIHAHGFLASFWRRALIAPALPTAATLAYEWATTRTPANWLRASAGFPLGAVVALIIVSACAVAAPREKVSKVN